MKVRMKASGLRNSAAQAAFDSEHVVQATDQQARGENVRRRDNRERTCCHSDGVSGAPTTRSEATQ